jgi:hypothetical protein
MLDRLAIPWTILPMGGDNHPLFPQRMPSFFPGHKVSFEPAATGIMATGLGSFAFAW